MKILLIFSAILITVYPAFGTESSKYIEKAYTQNHFGRRAHISVKNEHTQQSLQAFGKDFTPLISFGYGDLKIKGCKKCRISYICLMDCNGNTIRGWIIPR